MRRLLRQFSAVTRAPAPGAAAAPFVNPLSIAGCVAWFDMLDAGSYTQAGTVTSITNKASSVAWTEAVVPPAYSATGLNNHPCMDFDGTTMRIISTEAAVWQCVRDSSAYTLFAMCAADNVDRLEAIFGVGDSGQSASRRRDWGKASTTTGHWRCAETNDAVGTVTVESVATADTNSNVLIWQSPGTTVSFSLNNGTPDPSGAAMNPGTLTPNRSCLGARPISTPDLFFDGRLGELVLYNSNLSASDTTAVYNYMAARWA